MQQCKCCIMDSENDPDLKFSSNGICNHCYNFDTAISKLPIGSKATEYLKSQFAKIKEEGKFKKYDCIIGLSGGVDSTYLCLLAKQHGLRPLLVHCDNGWNTELSVKNIENVCSKSGYDLYTLVIDWNEIKDLQLSFMKAGVVDLELPYDYALITTAYKVAEEYGVKYVMTGHNVRTEGTYLPRSWRHTKMDIVNIKAIHRKFGKVKLKTFPAYSFIKQRYIDKKLEYLYPLNYIEFNKENAKQIITKEFEWRDYGGKHYENIFTRFYQGYILKEKFRIDKRQFHLSVLVQAGQLSREEALKQYATKGYDNALFEEDKKFVLKKLDLTVEEFDDYLKAPIKKHTDYPSIDNYWDLYFKVIKKVKPFVKFFIRKRTQ